MPKAADRSHAIVDIYDSTRQILTLCPDATAGKNHTICEDRAMAFRGRLRLDSLLNRKIFLKDGDIFDGIGFLHASSAAGEGAARLIDALPWGRIAVHSNYESLDQAIVGAFVNPAKMQPDQPGLYLSSLPPEQSAEIARESAPLLAGGVGSVEELVRCIGPVVDNSPEFMWWAGGVRQLIEAQEREGLIKLVKRPPMPDWNVWVQSILEDTRDTMVSKLSAEGRGRFEDVVERVGTSWGRRSVIYAILDDCFSSPEYLNGPIDRATVRTWYNRAYHSTVGIQNGCGALDLTAEPFALAIDPDDEFYDRTAAAIAAGRDAEIPKQLTIGLPRSFALSLATTPVPVFNDLEAHYAPALDKWYTEGSVVALNHVVREMVAQVAATNGLPDASWVPDGLISKVKVFCKWTIGGATASLAAAFPDHGPGVFMGGAVAVAAADGVENLVNSMDDKAVATRSIMRHAQGRNRSQKAH